MNELSTLTVLGVIPLVGAVLIGLVPRGRDLLVKQIALVTSLVVLVVTIGMCAAYEPDGARFQFSEVHDWISAFGVQYAVGVDGIALVLVALVAVLVPVVLLASWNDADPDSAEQAAAGARAGSRARSGRAAAGSSSAGATSVAVLEREDDDDRPPPTPRPPPARPRRRPPAA